MQIVRFLLIDLIPAAALVLLLRNRRRIFCADVDVLDRRESTKIRGLLAVLILLHHISITTATGVLMKTFAVVGIFCVAVFFFYSGYGLMTGYMQKENYLKGFFKKRIAKILIPYLISGVVTFLAHLLMRYKFTPSEIFNSLFTGDPIVKYSWYVLVILLLYLIFYIAARFLKKPILILPAVLAGTVGYAVIVETQFSWGNWTINSCLAFSFGILFAMYRDKYRPLLRGGKKTTLFMLVSALLAAVAVILNFVNSKIPVFLLMANPDFADYIMRSPSVFIAMNWIALVGILLFFQVCRKIRLNDRVFSFLGGISFELYLYHGLILALLRNDVFFVGSDLLYLLAAVPLSVLAALGMKKLDDRVYRVCVPSGRGDKGAQRQL